MLHVSCFNALENWQTSYGLIPSWKCMTKITVERFFRQCLSKLRLYAELRKLNKRTSNAWSHERYITHVKLATVVPFHLRKPEQPQKLPLCKFIKEGQNMRIPLHTFILGDMCKTIKTLLLITITDFCAIVLYAQQAYIYHRLKEEYIGRQLFFHASSRRQTSVPIWLEFWKKAAKEGLKFPKWIFWCTLFLMQLICWTIATLYTQGRTVYELNYILGICTRPYAIPRSSPRSSRRQGI